MRVFHALLVSFSVLSALLLTAGASALGADTGDTSGAASADTSGGQTTQLDAKALMQQADDAMKSKDFAKALGIYDQLAAAIKQSNNSQAYQLLAFVNVGRGKALAGMQEFDAAEAAFKEVLDQDSTNSLALIARGIERLDNQAVQPEVAAQLALQDFQSALEQDRTNTDALFGEGKAMAILGAGQQALKPLNTVISKDDKNAEAYRYRGLAYGAMAKYKQSHDDFEKSIQLDPEPYETYFTQGTVYLKEEKYDDAAKAIAEAIKRYKPQGDVEQPYAQGYLTHAAALCEAAKTEKDDAKKQADYQLAIAECDKLLELVGDNPTYASVKAATQFRKGVCLRMMGKLSDAINAFSDALKTNPDLGEAYIRRGICFFNLNENDLALADFQKAATLSYDEPRARLWEGFAEAKLGDYHEAIRAYGEAITASDRFVPAFVNRGLAYMMIGDYDKALADFDEAIRLEPTESAHYFKRGVVYERKGKSQEAADSFTTAIKLDTKNEQAYRHAATALAALGHNDLASEYRSKADALVPKGQQTKTQ
jgi:tetratricopeptide (TPR) repeat protein